MSNCFDLHFEGKEIENKKKNEIKTDRDRHINKKTVNRKRRT